jgi:imidazolonepropionase-like amidohydrolase
VKHLGFTPMEAILSATKHGGAIMQKGDELGQVKEGFLADLLLVDGDPLANLAILRDKAKILAVMKDGVFYKKPDMAAQRARWSRTAA